MNKWERKSFNEAPIEIIDGDRGINYPQKSDFKNEGYCLFLSTSNVTTSGFNFSSLDFISKLKDENLRKGKLNRGDIVLTTRGTVGNAAFYSNEIPYENIRINSGMIILRADTKEVHPYYLYLFLRSNIFKAQVISQGSGSAQPQLPIGSFKNILIPWKDLTTQKEIASVLASLDSKMELNNRINAELEAMAKTIYDYWFVQFDFPDESGKPYKSSGGKMVWKEELKREVPEGWKVGNLMMISSLEGGGTPSKTNSLYWEGDIPFYTPTDYTSSIFVTTTQACITKNGLDNCSSKLFPKGTIFITARGTVGNVIIASTETAMNQSCYAFCPKPDINYGFLYFSVKSLISILKAKSGGSVFNSIVSNDIKQAKLAIPPTSIVQKFANLSRPIFRKILTNAIENQHLSSLRDWLLPMLMNGQVNVGEVKETLSMAAERDEEYKKETAG